jgi:hypothetical protein
MARRPAVWTSAAFSMVSAAAAIVLLVVGVALFRLPETVSLPAAVSNQVANLPTSEQTQVTKIGDEESDTADADAARPGVDGEVAQQPQESRDLGFAATTSTPQSTAAPQLFAAVLPTPTPAVAGLMADTLSESAADQARQESQQAAPSAASGAAAAEAPLPAPTQLPPPTETETPTASPTPAPSLTPTPPPTSTFTATPLPTATPTPVPPAPALSEPGTLGVGLIAAALILLGIAIVTTLVRRRG